MTVSEITKDEFEQWRSSVVTKFIFKVLADHREGIGLSLTDENLIFKEDGGKQLARLVGMRNSIDLMLNIEFEDIEEVEDDRSRD